MSRSLIVEPEAETDILDGYIWYENREEGLGSRFIEELESAFNRVAANPMSYQEAEPDIRRSVTHVFPYLVFFSFDDDAVYVLAVIPASQNPAYIDARLEALG